MSEILPADLTTPWLLLPLLAVLLLLWLVYRRRRTPPRSLQAVVRDISFDRLDDFVIPKADEGEIHIEQLLLTAAGLVVLDVKDIDGIVFGSDKMQDWTVMANDRRYTFGNPQHALYDRIAAVRQIVTQVPVTGRVVFLDGARFTKGVPAMVCGLDELLAEFGEPDRHAAQRSIDAFKPHWEQIRAHARAVEAGRARRRRAPVLR